MKMKRNAEMTGMWAGIAILVAGGLGILVPPLSGMDMFGGGFALQFAGFFLVVTGLVTAAIFGYRASRLASMFRGQQVLAHWVYDPMQLRDQADRELAETKARNRMLLLIIAGFVVACTVLFVLIGYAEGEEESMPLFVAIMLGVLIIVAAFALGMPAVQYRRAMRSGGEAIIAEKGLYVNGVLHTWNAPLALLDDVYLTEDEGQARLVFKLRSLSRTMPGGYEEYQVQVPVPPGEESTARQVEEHFTTLMPLI